MIEPMTQSEYDQRITPYENIRLTHIHREGQSSWYTVNGKKTEKVYFETCLDCGDDTSPSLYYNRDLSSLKECPGRRQAVLSLVSS